ncbi:cytochrome c oxidase subunit 7A2, mitochondrial [Platysternon megacephalum]|uniref:Cytochrome c oxidase subunit 7A2, mitochondrial n=1 Tax=Platysternon megacephalum TaxID=55544 RepID=A0A4D9DRV5_9SAUR|nr:cytochrome c oxidase subunit 7A2, mitochondrial [Platysternon megacephalum]
MMGAVAGFESDPRLPPSLGMSECGELVWVSLAGIMPVLFKPCGLKEPPFRFVRESRAHENPTAAIEAGTGEDHISDSCLYLPGPLLPGYRVNKLKICASSRLSVIASLPLCKQCMQKPPAASHAALSSLMSSCWHNVNPCLLLLCCLFPAVLMFAALFISPELLKPVPTHLHWP